MLTRLGIWFVLAGCLSASGCVDRRPVIVGSGIMVGESYDLADFSRLSIHDSMDVTVLQGEGFAVEVSADDNLIEFIKVVQQGDELRIGWSQSLRLQRGSVVCVVHLPNLTGASVHGASQLHLKSLAVEQLVMELSGASRLDGELTGDKVVLNLSGACQAQLTGQAHTLEANIDGASKAELDQFVVVQNATIDVSGASRARVNALGELSMVASGASNVSFVGHPTIVRSDTHGASSIRPE